jgi:hypothetical protein
MGYALCREVTASYVAGERMASFNMKEIAHVCAS